MAKLYLDRLKKKYYRPGKVKGQTYRDLIKMILQSNNENVSRAVARETAKTFDKETEKLKKTDKRVVLPNLGDVLPKRSVYSIKAANTGDLMTDNIRDAITKDLRETMRKRMEDGTLVMKTGKYAGRVNPEIVKEFQEKIKVTFEGYTKRDPKFKVPGNIRQIAVTETRTTIDMIKDEYYKRLIARNGDRVEARKVWRHNKTLSKTPRIGHMEMNGVDIPYNSYFKVPYYDGTEHIRDDNMFKPHDINAPAEQNISCNCDFIVYMRIK